MTCEICEENIKTLPVHGKRVCVNCKGAYYKLSTSLFEHVSTNSKNFQVSKDKNELGKLQKMIPLVYEYLNNTEKCNRKQGFVKNRLCQSSKESSCRFCRYRLCLLILKKFPKLRLNSQKQKELIVLYTFLNSYRIELFGRLVQLAEHESQNQTLNEKLQESKKMVFAKIDVEKNACGKSNLSPAISVKTLNPKRPSAKLEVISSLDLTLKKIHVNKHAHTHFRNRIDLNFEVYDVILGVGLKRNDGSFLTHRGIG